MEGQSVIKSAQFIPSKDENNGLKISKNIHLALAEDNTEAVEELKGGEDMTLYEDAGGYSGRRPPACADGHLIKPGLEGEMAGLAGEDVGHGGNPWMQTVIS